MEVNEFTGASGLKYATAGNWSLAHKPKSNEQAFIPAGKTCEVAATGECGSLKVRGHLTGGIAELRVGGAEAGPGNVLCDFVGAEGVTWGGTFLFVGTFATTAQTVSLGGFTIGSFRIGTLATGKIKLLEGITASATTSGVLGEGGKAPLEFNGQTIIARNVEFREGSTADFTNAVFRCSGEGGAFMLSNIGTTFTGLASATVEVNERTAGELSPAKQVNGAGKEIGTIIVTGFNVTLEALMWGTLGIENSGCAAGKGCKLKVGTVFAGVAITANGTEAKPARLESSIGGTATVLKLAEQELVSGFLAVKDMAIESGPWYVPLVHGKNEGGNSAVGATILFEGKSKSAFVSAIDALALVDAAARLIQAARGQVDALGLADTASMVRAAVRSRLDAATLVDSAATARIATRGATDPLALAEAETVARVAKRASAAALALADAGSAGHSAKGADTLGLTEGATVTRVTARAAVDAIAVVDAGARVGVAGRSGAATAGVAGTGTRGSFARPRSATSVLGLVCGAARSTVVARGALDVAALADAASRTRTMPRLGTDAIAAAGSVTRVATKARFGSDALEVNSATKLQSSAVGSLTVGIATAYYRAPPWRGEPGRIVGTGQSARIVGAAEPGHLTGGPPGHFVR